MALVLSRSAVRPGLFTMLYQVSHEYVCNFLEICMCYFSAHKFTSSGAQNVCVVSTTEILELS